MKRRGPASTKISEPDVWRAGACDKKRPPEDLAWLFSQVAMAARDDSVAAGGERDNAAQLFRCLPGGALGVAPLERQTYRQWRSLVELQKVSQPRRLRQKTVLVQPFISPTLPGYSLREVAPQVLGNLCSFCSAFFPGLQVTLAPPIELDSVPGLASRVHGQTKRVQFLVGDLIKFLESHRPRSARCVMGVVTVDLYPSPEWNFVMGHASLASGCGVLSFGRYFNTQFANMAPSLPQQLQHLLVLARTVSHELCHTLGMKHCYYFSCAMNESSSVAEAADQPLFLCPVCLRKLKKVLRFDIFQRYSALRQAVSDLLCISTSVPTGSCVKLDTSDRAVCFAGQVVDSLKCDSVSTNQPLLTKTKGCGDGQLEAHREGRLEAGSEENPSIITDWSTHLHGAVQWLDRACESHKHASPSP